MEIRSMTNKIYAGIDVSKDYLDVHLSDCRRMRKKNISSGIKLIVELFKTSAVYLVVVEATGGYEQKLVEALQVEGVAVSVVNPSRTKSFARSLGRNAKSDLLDAEILCLFGERMNPVRTKPLDEATKELKSLILRREQLVETLTAEKNRLKAPVITEEVRMSVEEVVHFINKQIKTLNQKIKTKISDNNDFSNKNQLLQNIQGVGQTTSATLIALLPEIGKINRKQIAALVGVAPFNKESGRYSGKRSVYGGRTHVRAVLYMATMTAIRMNPCFKNFFLRLVQAGKNGKVAIVACMRKLLITLNAMVRDGKQWSSDRYLTQHI